MRAAVQLLTQETPEARAQERRSPTVATSAGFAPLTKMIVASLALLTGLVGMATAQEPADRPAQKPLMVGFGSADITPDMETKKPVWMAGYGNGRRATGVHDPLMARVVTLAHDDQKIAIVSVDLIGLQYPEVKRIREELADFAYVLVTSTHNHEGPDVIGIWGRGPISRGVDDAYVDLIIARVVQACRDADGSAVAATAKLGTESNEELLGDSRLPKVKDPILRALRFDRAGTDEPIGLLVQWNCHPEALGPKNTLLTADFPAATVDKLSKQYGCPVVYASGALGGLMAPPDGVIKSDAGEPLLEGDFEFSNQYGYAVAKVAAAAIDGSRAIELRPLRVEKQTIAIPVKNPLYRLARLLGVLKRDVYLWTGSPDEVGAKVTSENRDLSVGKLTAVESEVACLALGDLRIACIPGELYPELVYGNFQEPAADGVDYPEASLEPTVESNFPRKSWMLLGLANDEVGYIIPKRQWDKAAPYAYGKPDGQYGEINSCGPDTAPIVMQTLRDLVERIDGPPDASTDSRNVPAVRVKVEEGPAVVVKSASEESEVRVPTPAPVAIPVPAETSSGQ